MNFKESGLMVLAYFTFVVTASDINFSHHSSDMSLLNFMSASNDLLQQNPERSLDCFNYYIPLINEVIKRYEVDYKSCLDTSAAARVQVEEDTLDQRGDLSKRADGSCVQLSKCSEIDSVQEEFECYIKGGSENAKTMYSINVDASDELAELLEQYHLVEATEYRCTNETKREYEKESNEAYENFNNCILGISEVPTEGPSTVEPSTQEPTTVSPTTVEPSTQPTTAEPSTAEPTTVEPTTQAPTTVEPTTQTPTTQEPTTQESTTQAPTTQESTTQQPTTQESTTQESTTQEPTTQESTTSAPTTQESTTQESTTEESTTQESTTQAPTTEELTTDDSITETNPSSDTYDEYLPEEDLSRTLALKNLKYRLEHYKV